MFKKSSNENSLVFQALLPIVQARSTERPFFNEVGLFNALQKLHKLWFQINLLQERFSGRSEEKKNQLLGEFLVLAPKVTQQMIAQYQEWYENHTEEGWWERGWGELILEGGYVPVNGKLLDVRPEIAKILENQIVKETDWSQELKSIEYEWSAWEYLVTLMQQKHPELSKEPDRLEELVEDQIGGAVSESDKDVEAYSYMREEDILDDYNKWLLDTKRFDPQEYVSLEDQFGNSWWEEIMRNQKTLPYFNNKLMELLEDGTVKNIAWKKWLEIWTTYIPVFKQVSQTIQNLKNVLNSSDPNTVMRTISLALNVAHNSGLMYEHLSLTENDMNQLSNLDTEPWKQEIKHYAQKKEHPQVLYHVTPFADEILKEGFKKDINETFGGSNQSGLSFTSLEGAQNYAKGLKWMIKWSNGQVTDDMKSPDSIWKIAKEFGLDGIDVQQAISSALSMGGYSRYPQEIFEKSPQKKKAFIYDVLVQFARLSKNKFPWVFRRGIENMLKKGKNENDVKIVKVTLPSQKAHQRIQSENEWRIEPQDLTDAKLEILST